jgi:acetyltransferase-like isoleucine patch superfamily enzyme
MKAELFYAHPRAIIDTKKVGKNTRIWAFVHILKGAKIGANCNICEHCFIENDVVLGDNVTIKCGVYLWDGVRIEDNVFIGPNATFTNDLYPRSKVYPNKRPRLLIKEGASIGAASVLLPAVTIGKYALIGAGAVVTKDVGDYELVYGNPASRAGYICKCKSKLKFTKRRIIQCACGASYQLRKGIVSKI